MKQGIPFLMISFIVLASVNSGNRNILRASDLDAITMSHRNTPPPTYTPFFSPTPIPPTMVLYVPADFETIQEALDAAAAHTEIYISPGTYPENLQWPHTPGIRIIAAGEPGSVIIDGGLRDRVIVISDVPAPGAALSGIRATRGIHSSGGAGIHIEASTVVMTQCDISDNLAIPDSLGNLDRPGIVCIDSDVTMIRCLIHRHYALCSSGSGLTVNCPGCLVWLEGCVLSENFNRFSCDAGGAVTHLAGTLIVKNCEFIGNWAEMGAAIFSNAPCLVEFSLITDSRSDTSDGFSIGLMHDESMLLYNTVSNNAQTAVEVTGSALLRGNIICSNRVGIESEQSACVILEYNDIWNNTVDYSGAEPSESDVSVDPLFTQGELGWFYLSQISAGQGIDSPCVDMGDGITMPRGFTRTDAVSDELIIDLGFHRRSDLPELVPTLVPPTPTSVTPTPTPVMPTPTPTPTLGYPTPTPMEGVRYVPFQYQTIQSAIRHAEPGECVLVFDGTYSGLGNTDIVFLGKPITVRSHRGPDTTIIDCNGTDTQPHRGFRFESGDESGCVLDGFTIMGGFHDIGAGILLLPGTSPQIRNCRIVHCQALSSGGGIHAVSSGFTMENTDISHCEAGWGGGAVSILGWHDPAPVIYQTKISDNCCGSYNNAGGIYIQYGAEPKLTSCEFFDNRNNALVFESGESCFLELSNCLFVRNSGGTDVRVGSADIINCTYAGNSRYAVSGTVDYGIVNLIRTCFWGPEDIGIDISYGEYSNIPNDINAQHSFHSDPVFVSGPKGDHYLYQNVPGHSFSPNVNTGGVTSESVFFPVPGGYSINMESLTTCPDQLPYEFPDIRFADIGYHYPMVASGTPTPRPPENPIIEDILGSTEDFRANAEMSFLISAKVTHPAKGGVIDTVELYWENFPTSWKLYDDGTHGDSTANDGRYTRWLKLSAYYLPPHEYKMYVVAFDKQGRTSEKVPYVILVERNETILRPAISGRHIWYSPVDIASTHDLGFLWIIAKVEHPFGRNHIAKVEITYMNQPTGIELIDDGLHGDLEKEDGYYGLLFFYEKLETQSPVEVDIGIESTDIDGITSSPWPITWKIQ